MTRVEYLQESRIVHDHPTYMTDIVRLLVRAVGSVALTTSQNRRIPIGVDRYDVMGNTPQQVDVWFGDPQPLR